MSTVEILDGAANLLREHWVSWLALSSVGTLPLCLLVLVYFQWVGTMHAGTEAGAFYTGTLWWALGMTAAWTLNTVARAAITDSALAAARGEDLASAGAWRAAWKVAAGTSFIGLVAFVAAWVAGACAPFPALVLVNAWWVARPALISEGKPFAASLRRSWQLTTGYRGRAFALWVLYLVFWSVCALNLHLLVKFMLETGAGMLGIDTSSARLMLNPGNIVYLAFLVVLSFAVLDPLKTALDTLLYLDIRVRREGADLQERLRALSGGVTTAVTLIMLGGSLLASPAASAATPDEYASRLRALRAQIEKAPKPEAVPEGALREIQSQVVQLPSGKKMTAENDSLARRARTWSTPAQKEALLRRLEGLERSLGGMAGTSEASPTPTGPAGSTAGTPPPAIPGTPSIPAPDEARQNLQQLLTEPEFQPLAERTELRDLMKNVRLPDTKNWWQSFWKWVQNNLFKPPKPPQIQAPQTGPPPRWNGAWIQPAFYMVLGIAALALVVMLIRWIIERPVREEPAAAAIAKAEVLEKASATENALDHTVDEWELFAREWLGRGDIRQAVRALYLATLVHLHRERRIEYNRALTNWIYVRQFRGEGDQKGIFRNLTRTFDEVWYGERQLGEELYRTFEQGVRALGTPAPGTVPGGATRG